MVLCERHGVYEKVAFRHIIYLCHIFVVQIKHRQIQKKIVVEKFAILITIRSLCQHCLAFCGVGKRGPHEHSFLSSSLWPKRYI